MSEPTEDTKTALEDIVYKVAREIEARKEKVIRTKLKEKGLSYVLKDLAKRRFKRLMIIGDEKAETVYVDDNSIGGLRLVTFLKDETKIDQVDPENIKVNLRYF